MSTTTRPSAPPRRETGPPPEAALGGRPPLGRRRTPIGRWAANAVLLALCLLWTIPTVGLLVSSFRDRDAVSSSGWWTVLANPLEFTQWTLDNYRSVLFDAGMGNAFLNSFVVAVPATVIPILMAAFAAYAFSWMRFPGRQVLFVLLVGLLVVPLQVAFIPLLQLFRALGVTGTFLSLWLAHAGFGMPLAVYILRNYMATLPREVIESAQVDGASHFQVFWRLILPLSRRPSPPSPSSSSCGSGTTCWSR